jgi:hypothetical protein
MQQTHYTRLLSNSAVYACILCDICTGGAGGGLVLNVTGSGLVASDTYLCSFTVYDSNGTAVASEGNYADQVKCRRWSKKPLI